MTLSTKLQVRFFLFVLALTVTPCVLLGGAPGLYFLAAFMSWICAIAFTVMRGMVICHHRYNG